MKELGLYIHIPFCKSKCYYCDFNSYSGRESIQGEYVDAVIKEMDMRSSILEDYRIKSVYIGGGTPTFLNLQSLSRLLGYLKRYGGNNVEYSCESNPGTLTYDKLELLKKNGVNRLSIGLQSWDNNILRYLGRIHSAEDFIENYSLARDAGFNNINVDLMSSIQGQTMEIFSSTLDNVISLKPEHISCYSLIIEEGTVFGERYKSGLLSEMDEDMDREMYYYAVKRLKDAGFLRYEISNFSKPGFESRHNIIYWETKPYLGIGAGAHSYVGDTRFSNEIIPEKYIGSIMSCELPVVSKEELTYDDKMSEFMFMGLRMASGIGLQEFEQRFGTPLLSVYASEVESLIQKKLVCLKDNRLFLTDKGIDLSNQVFVEFLR